MKPYALDKTGSVKNSKATRDKGHRRGLLLGITYSDSTTAESFVYNHLGQLNLVTDSAGIRAFGYNAYGEQETDSLLAEGVTHLVTETRDSFGRSTGYTYTKGDATQQTVTTAYGADGRISGAGFIHGGQEKQFGYTYLQGTHLLQTLTKPNGMTLTQTYDQHRDLLTQMDYKRGNTLVARRSYQYDTLGRPTSRTLARQGATRNDVFTYNDRSEIISDVVDGTGLNGWDYDNIGNRLVQQQGSACDTYTSNALNQYTAIEDESHDVFTPTYDDDGNQTRIKTSTGIWNVTYNAKNRPVLFTKEGENLTVACTYDYMGRRATKVVTENGQITSSHRFLYRGYLQIACCDRKRSLSQSTLIFMNNVMNKVVSFIILAISFTMCAHGIDWSNIDKENVDNARYVILRTDGKPGLYEQLTRDETIELLEIISHGSHHEPPVRGRTSYRVKSVFEIRIKSGEILSFCPDEALLYSSKSRFVLPLSQKEPIEKLIKKILRRTKYQF